MGKFYYEISGNKNELPRVINNIFKALKDTRHSLIKPTVRKAWEVGVDNTKRFKWSGGLGDGIDTDLAYVKTKNEGYLYVNDEQKYVAWQNEFGTKKRYVPFSVAPLLRTWAKDKAPHLAKGKGIWIGGERSRVKLGNSDNQFWKRTLNVMNSKISRIVEEQIDHNLTSKRM
jgi:hypothetical protein